MKSPKLGGAVYVLPNLITTGNLFFGFFSIIKCEQGHYLWAASAILLATVFDVLDGRVARLTGGTSEFGVQYDSLCDLVSFGIAPAFIMYKVGLLDYGRLGWVLCFLYVACTTLRLARFNVQSSIGQAGGNFTGLPSPMAAIVIACFLLVKIDATTSPQFLQNIGLVDFVQTDIFNYGFLLLAAPLLALAMVSNFVYRSHKVFAIGQVKPFKLLVFMVLILALAAYEPSFFGFFFAVIYALSGPFEWLLGWKKAVDEDDIFRPISEHESPMEPK